LPHHPKVKGASPAAAASTVRQKIAKNNYKSKNDGLEWKHRPGQGATTLSITTLNITTFSI
jgi:hypothetical protein